MMRRVTARFADFHGVGTVYLPAPLMGPWIWMRPVKLLSHRNKLRTPGSNQNATREDMGQNTLIRDRCGQASKGHVILCLGREERNRGNQPIIAPSQNSSR